MESYKKIFIILCGVFISAFIFLLFSFMYNRNTVKPTKAEIVVLNSFYKSLIEVKNIKDIISLQNHTIESIIHDENGVGEIDIINVLKTKKGLCFHRSMVLQKVMLLNGISIRPVFLYSDPFDDNTSMLDFFSNKIYTHNIFEFYYQEKWYIMETNKKMTNLSTLNQFLSNQKIFKTHPRYLKFLNNRNGRFIKPVWIPDIYGFF
jgi:hypothetical protein